MSGVETDSSHPIPPALAHVPVQAAVPAKIKEKSPGSFLALSPMRYTGNRSWLLLTGAGGSPSSIGGLNHRRVSALLRLETLEARAARLRWSQGFGRKLIYRFYLRRRRRHLLVGNSLLTPDDGGDERIGTARSDRSPVLSWESMRRVWEIPRGFLKKEVRSLRLIGEVARFGCRLTVQGE